MLLWLSAPFTLCCFCFHLSSETANKCKYNSYYGWNTSQNIHTNQFWQVWLLFSKNKRQLVTSRDVGLFAVRCDRVVGWDAGRWPRWLKAAEKQSKQPAGRTGPKLPRALFVPSNPWQNTNPAVRHVEPGAATAFCLCGRRPRLQTAASSPLMWGLAFE